MHLLENDMLKHCDDDRYKDDGECYLDDLRKKSNFKVLLLREVDFSRGEDLLRWLTGS